MIMLEALVFGGVALGMLLCYVLGPSVCGDGEDITGTWASDSSPLLSLASQPALVRRRALKSAKCIWPSDFARKLIQERLCGLIHLRIRLTAGGP